MSVLLVMLTRDFETLFPEARVLRDYTATSISFGKGMERRLLINGVGMTSLTPITKMMAHLPLASLPTPPRNVLVLCFGMGTSFRSALSWGVPVTVVELVPSVPKLFSYFHADGDQLMRSSERRVVIDDARRFLERTQELFDVIVIDPPPPVAAAGFQLPLFHRVLPGSAQPSKPRRHFTTVAAGRETHRQVRVRPILAASFRDVRVFNSIMDGAIIFWPALRR